MFLIFELFLFIVVRVEKMAFKKAYFTLTVCGSVVNNSLKSPGYPVTEYHSNMDCIYLVSIPHNMAMNISFKDFEIEAGLPDCE